MKRIDFYISNNNHHWQMSKPVMQALQHSRRAAVRLVSLCEFRRMETPVAEITALAMPYFILRGLKFKGATTATGKKHIGGNQSSIRNLLRNLLWQFWLKPSLVKCNEDRPDLVVVPNDVAFPFDRVCKWLSKKNIPFIVFQEGIRFPLPNEEGQTNYGGNGAKAVYTWGEESADYFRSIGLKSTVVRAVGNPRFDSILQNDYASEIEKIRAAYPTAQYNLLYVSNPVDDQGFCSHEEKLGLFKKFVTGIKPLAGRYDLLLWIRLHPREDVSAFEAVASEMQGINIVFAQKPSLFALLQVMDGAIVLASTVGIEATMMGVPIGIIKLPGYDYVFDYVSSGLAYAVDVNDDVAHVVEKLMTTGRAEKKQAMHQYLANHFTNLGKSTSTVADALLSEL